MLDQNMPATYGDIEAQSHQNTLSLLGEVADYLSRLPAHPMTHAMHAKLQSHLDNPGARALKARLAILANDEVDSARVMSGVGFKGGSRYMPSGLPVIAARMLYPTLTLVSPAVQWHLKNGEPTKAKNLSVAIGREIASGVVIDMSPLHPVLDRVWTGPTFVSAANGADKNS